MISKTIGLFGGTFDPIHIGHLRMALELKTGLGLDEMRLLPCREPPHRQQTVASAEQRLSMVEIAIANCEELKIDRSELSHAGPSYSVDTVERLRGQLGSEVSLCLAMGMDSLVNLNSWYRWQDILRGAHILVAARPGWRLPTSGEMADYIAQHQQQPEYLRRAAAGGIVIKDLSLLPISSSDIRKQLGRGENPQYLVPDSVFEYLKAMSLYQ